MLSIDIRDGQPVSREVVDSPAAPSDEPETLCQSLDDCADDRAMEVIARYTAVIASQLRCQPDIKSLREVHANHGTRNLACDLRYRARRPGDTIGSSTWRSLEEDSLFFCRRLHLREASSDKDTGPGLTIYDCILRLSEAQRWSFDKGRELDQLETAFHLGQYAGIRGYLPPSGDPQKGLSLLVKLRGPSLPQVRAPPGLAPIPPPPPQSNSLYKQLERRVRVLERQQGMEEEEEEEEEEGKKDGKKEETKWLIPTWVISAVADFLLALLCIFLSRR